MGARVQCVWRRGVCRQIRKKYIQGCSDGMKDDGCTNDCFAKPGPAFDSTLLIVFDAQELAKQDAYFVICCAAQWALQQLSSNSHFKIV